MDSLAFAADFPFLGNEFANTGVSSTKNARDESRRGCFLIVRTGCIIPAWRRSGSSSSGKLLREKMHGPQNS